MENNIGINEFWLIAQLCKTAYISNNFQKNTNSDSNSPHTHSISFAVAYFDFAFIFVPTRLIMIQKSFGMRIQTTSLQ
jgi:hypothetical protein